MDSYWVVELAWPVWRLSWKHNLPSAVGNHVYLDFAKAYNSLDQECTLIILKDYGVGPNVLQLLTMF